MAITLRANYSSNGSTTTSVATSYTGSPAVVAGDLLVAIVTVAGSSSSTTISGWSDVLDVTVSGNAVSSVFTKTAAGGETSITANNSTATRMAITLLDLVGANISAGVVASSSKSSQVANTSMTETALSYSTTTGAVAISFVGQGAGVNGGSNPWTNLGTGATDITNGNAGTIVQQVGVFINSSTFSSYAPTANWTTSRVNGGGIVIFEVASASALSINVSDTTTTSENVVSNADTDPSVSDTTITSEAVTIRSDTDPAVSDTTITSEYIQLEADDNIGVSDTTITSENIQIEVDGNIKVSDTTTTSEAINEQSSIQVTVSDTTITSENISLLIPTLSIKVSDTTTTSELVSVSSATVGYSLVAANIAQSEGVSPQTATYAQTPAAGSLLIATVKRNTQSGTAVSAKDGNNNPFTVLQTLNYDGTAAELVVLGMIAGASQSLTVITAGAGTHFLDIYEFDYSGGTLPVIGSIVDGTIGTATATSGTSTSGSQPSVTATGANDLIFTSIGWVPAVTAPSSTNATFLQSNFTGTIELGDAYQIETSTGTYDPYFSWTSSREWAQITIAFLPGSTGVAPGTPTGLTVVADNDYRARISWTAADSTQTNFILQRSTDHITWATIASPTTAYYMDTGLSSSTTYYYQVAATNSSGTSSYAAYQSCTTFGVNPPWTSQIEGWFYPTAVYSPVTDYSDGRSTFILKPQYFTVETGGVITQLNAPGDGTYAYSSGNASSVKSYSQEQFITVSSNYANFHSLMGSSTNQSNGITALVSFVVSNGFTGVELDWEGFSSWTSGDYSTYKSFLSSLATSLHSNSKKLMVDGPPIGIATTYTDLAQSYYLFKYEDIAPLVDYVCVLAYDYEYDYSAGTPVQPLAWLQTIVNWTIAKVGWANLSQVVIGMPSYGYHGTTGSYSITIDQYDDSVGYTGFSGATRDSSSAEMTWATGGVSYFYSDQTSMDTKRTTIEDMGILNTSVWSLGGNQWFETKGIDSVSVSDTTTTSENITAALPALAANVSDTTTTSEQVKLLIPTLFIGISDTTVTSESVTVSIPAAGALSINVSDTTTTSEGIGRGADVNIPVQDATVTSEVVKAVIPTLLVKVADTTITSENIGVIPNPLMVKISDTTVTSEAISLFGKADLKIQVADTTVTSESVSVPTPTYPPSPFGPLVYHIVRSPGLTFKVTR